MNYRIVLFAAAAILLTAACSSDKKSDGSSATSAASTPHKSIAPAVSAPTSTPKSAKDNEISYHRYRSYSGSYERTSGE